jgi:hypothetical protein
MRPVLVSQARYLDDVIVTEAADCSTVRHVQDQRDLPAAAAAATICSGDSLWPLEQVAGLVASMGTVSSCSAEIRASRSPIARSIWFAG